MSAIQPAYVERLCRSCGGRLDTILHLGNLAVVAFPAPGDPPPLTAPLDWCACVDCRLVQLRHTVEADRLFSGAYWYRSGVNEQMRAELADIVDKALLMVGAPKTHEFVVDVGANDGTLLRVYKEHPLTRHTSRIAFEPSASLQSVLRPHAEVCVRDFFPRGLDQLRGIAGRVKVLTSIACFYDVDDPKDFVRAVDAILHPDGVWVVQFQDLWQMLQATAFDNIVAEHLCYYSLASFARLLEGTDLHITHAQSRVINGGSLRLFVQRRSKLVDGTVATLAQVEQEAESWQALETFAWRVGEVRQQITTMVDVLVTGGQTVDLYAASTKANTLLQYCGLGPEAIRQAWERSPEKVGRTTATGIPIVSEETGRADPPDALLLGAWQFRDAFVQREGAYLQRGGTMLVPLPAVEWVQQHADPADPVGGFWEDDDAIAKPPSA